MKYSSREPETMQVDCEARHGALLADAAHQLADEFWNALTHGIGLALSIAALSVMVAIAAMRGGASHIVGTAVFGASLVTLYAASTLYHSSRRAEWRAFFRMVDHACIYLLIAGTYTPFTLTLLKGGAGWALLGVIWGLALAGIIFKLIFKHRYGAVSLGFYLLMGWAALFAIKPILEQIPMGCLMWMLAGGIAYTVGTIFYALDHIRFFHPVWHGFVMAGSGCHFIAVFFYVLP